MIEGAVTVLLATGLPTAAAVTTQLARSDGTGGPPAGLASFLCKCAIAAARACGDLAKPEIAGENATGVWLDGLLQARIELVRCAGLVSLWCQQRRTATEVQDEESVCLARDLVQQLVFVLHNGVCQLYKATVYDPSDSRQPMSTAACLVQSKHALVEVVQAAIDALMRLLCPSVGLTPDTVTVILPSFLIFLGFEALTQVI